MKSFLAGLATGIAGAIGGCVYLNLIGRKELIETLLATVPLILTALVVLLVLLAFGPLFRLAMSWRRAGEIIATAEEKAAAIIAESQKTRLAAERQAEIAKTRHHELEHTYREKKERWLAEIVGLRQKNQHLGETVAELKLALKRKKKSHYRNIAEAATREE